MKVDESTTSESPSRRSLSGFLRAGCEVFRLPNLLTVPGDPMAGFLVIWATGLTSREREGTVWLTHWFSWQLLLLAGAISLLLYMSGLALNDWADRDIDAIERPGRPIPSGRVSARSVLLVGAGLQIAALMLATIIASPVLLVTAGLALLIVGYNFYGKRVAVAGLLCLGACRAGSFLLGAVAAGWWGQAEQATTILVAMAWIFALVVSISWIAAGEAKQRNIGLAIWAPTAILAAGGAWLIAHSFLAGANWEPWVGLYLIAWQVARSVTFSLALRGYPKPAMVQGAVGQWLRGLLLLQAAIIICLVGQQAAVPVFVAVMILFPLGGLLGKRFYAS